ncbi:unnamed protein product [Brassica rapa]|uniref:Methyltransferase n=1 Tax=Brassica campestris TaxID=3711 RepID=A0A8D9HAL5_BRACM|nr:unnamed protein product [Brassica rapa]
MIVEKLLFQSYFKGVGIDWWCSLVSVMVEVDRILRPQETFIVNDGMEKIGEIEKMMESLKWNVRMTHSRYGEGSSDLCSEVMVASYRGRDHYIGHIK